MAGSMEDQFSLLASNVSRYLRNTRQSAATFFLSPSPST